MNKKQTKTKKQVARSFYLILAASAVFGLLLSIGSAILIDSLQTLISSLYISLQRVSPWIVLILAAVVLSSSLWFLLRAKRFCRDWNGEDEDAFYQQADRLLNWSLGCSSMGTILLFTSFGLAAVSVFHENCDIYLFLGTAILFIISIILLVLIQRKCVEQVKALNPEKRGDALDIRFQKEWLESCDEQEQLAIYRASYKAFSTLPLICGFLFVALVLFLPYFNISFLPFLCVGLLWGIPNGVYLRECTRRKAASSSSFTRTS